MARVARIVPEFCARVKAKSRATPCARWNKEFLSRGALYLFNCCTNNANWEVLSDHGGTEATEVLKPRNLALSEAERDANDANMKKAGGCRVGLAPPTICFHPQIMSLRAERGNLPICHLKNGGN
jgi:hypothetical protein